MTEEEKKRIERGLGRVEFIKHIREIRRMLINGYSYTEIHKTLKEQGKFTMSYKTFYQILKPRKVKLPGGDK